MKKVLFVNQGISPYLPESQMTLRGCDVPRKIQESGCQIRTFLPQWGCINERRNQLHEVIRLSGMNIIISGNDHPLIIKVASLQSARMQVYFIDNDDYFDKRGIIGDKEGEEYDDNGERSVFYARGVLETVKKLRWNPDIVQCQGWISAVTPFYIKTAFKDEPAFSKSKVVFELNDTVLTKPLPENFNSCLLTRNVTKAMLKKENINPTAAADIIKLGIRYSDAVTIGSENVGKEFTEYAESLGKPVMQYTDKDYASAYGAFYDKLTEGK